MNNIISIDAETDGLWGKPFAIAAIVYDDKGIEVEKICLRLSNEVVTNEWVKENVLPTLNFPVTHCLNNFFAQFSQNEPRKKAYRAMMFTFAQFYMKHKDATALWHMGHVVESFLFRELLRLDLIGEFDAPYLPIEVSAYLEQANEKADSVDEYVEKYHLNISDYGSTHNPLYDCEVAYKVYKNINEKR